MLLTLPPAASGRPRLRAADIVDKCLCAGYVPDSLAGPLADGTEGGTALHLAAAQGWEAVVELLLEAGADPCHLDFAARNALDLAVLHGHLHLVPPLLEAGCWFSGGEGSEDGPPQPGPGEPGHAQVGLLWCLSAEAPWELQAFAGLQDGTEVVADSFRLTFAECAARGAARQPSCRGCALALYAGAHACTAALSTCSCLLSPCPAAGQLETLQRLHPRGLDLSGGSGCAVLAAAVHSGAAPLVRWLLDESGGRCDVAAALDQVRRRACQLRWRWHGLPAGHACSCHCAPHRLTPAHSWLPILPTGGPVA